MKKIKFAKINVGKIDWKDFFSYIFLVLLSSLILASVLIALPLTERISTQTTYDLNSKSNLYWAKEYTLELETSEEKDIDGIKSVLFNRLNKLGVEKVNMNSYTEDEITYLQVQVQSSLRQEYVQELVQNPFDVRVVTRNNEVNFEDEENPYAIYLAENYIETEFSRSDFRNIYITQLKNSANEYSYFALFKTWPWDSKWNNFLKDNMGMEIGVAIDDFVTPVQIPSTEPLIFAVPISSVEKEEANLVSIMYNSGVMPAGYVLSDIQDIEIESLEVDYIKLIEGLIIAIVVIYAYLLLIDRTPKRILVISGLATVIAISLWIAYLKITAIPVDIFLLAIEALTMVAILRITTENRESRIIVNVLLALIASLVAILGSGYAKIFASDLFILLILGVISQEIAQIYTDKVKRMLKI
jgi:hypothetical protein